MTKTNTASETNHRNTANPVFLQSCDFYGKDKATILFNADAVIDAVLSDNPSVLLHEAYDKETRRVLSRTSMTEEEAKFAALVVLLGNAYDSDVALIQPVSDSRVVAAYAWADGYEAARAAAAAG